MDIATQISEAFPEDIVLRAAEDLQYYGKDSSREFAPRPSVILMPKSEAQVSEILRFCNARGLPVVPSGGRTGYSAAAMATQGEVVLSLARMNRILEVNEWEQTLRCEAGATTEAIRTKAAEHGLFYPVDFASKGSSHIGGNIATNAGGIRVIRYGNTREWVLGLRAVLASGEIVDLNGSLWKNATGYDLRNLLIGSEGTLGVVTEATLRLTSSPKTSTLALCAIDGPAASLEILKALRSAGFTITLIEYFERNALELVVRSTGLGDPFQGASAAYTLIEAETVGSTEEERYKTAVMKLIEDGIVADAVVAESQKQYQSLLGLRERISESIGKEFVPHKNDIAVPISKIPEFVREYRAEIQRNFPSFGLIVFGHIGDGNLHLNLLKPEHMSSEEFFRICAEADQKTFALVQKLRGSISAEHGVGLVKKPFLHFSRSAEEIQLMRQVKAAFDPKGILNPGKIFD